jgi:hypothetical protein
VLEQKTGSEHEDEEDDDEEEQVKKGSSGHSKGVVETQRLRWIGKIRVSRFPGDLRD